MEGFTLKVTAAATLTLAAAAAGRALGMARQMRVKQLHALGQGISTLKINMLEKLLPLGEALTRSGCDGLERVGKTLEGKRPQEAFQDARQALTARQGPFSCLEREEMETVGRLFENLGATGAAHQRMLLEDAVRQLERIELRAGQNAREQARLYGTLGLLAGLALSVCLL